jgi:hypothetical protein
LRRGENADRASPSRVRQLRQRIGEERMPVAHADIHGQGNVAAAQCPFERCRLLHRQLGQGRDAAEPLVVMRDLFHPFGTDAASAQDVLEKRTHVGGPLRAAECHEQHGVERH